MTFSFKPLLLSTLVLASASTQAHRLWILPDVTVLSGDNPAVTFDAAVSNSIFNFDHVALRTDGIRISGPDGRAVAPENVAKGKFRSVFDLSLEQPGSYRVFMTMQGMNAFWKDADGKRHMFPGRGKTASGDEILNAIPKDQPVRIVESYRRAETFVTAGAPSANVQSISGVGVELKASTHPNDLYAGESAQFALLLNGEPLQGADITLIKEGTRYRDSQNEIQLSSDKNGAFSINWQGAGRYFMEAEYKDSNATKPATERSVSYTAVFEVLPD